MATAKKGSAKRQGETLATALKTGGAIESKVKEKAAKAAKPATKAPAKGAPNVSMLDKAGTVTKDFMHDQADLDRGSARATKIDAGLNFAKDACAAMMKAIAHGKATDSDAMKLAVLTEVGDLGNQIRDKARKTAREAKAPQANVQNDA